jgi:bifunctional ADP-heptose synthase (sugar kinase/adenylyltransferase)
MRSEEDNGKQMAALATRFCRSLAGELKPGGFEEAVASLSNLKVLIIGDTIFDRYSFVKVQGLTSKNRIISGRFIEEETQCGGALAVFRHVKQFTSNVKFLSLVGTEPWVDPALSEHVAPGEDLVIREPRFTTIIKQRFVEPLAAGKELMKLFAVNYIDGDPPDREVQERVLAQLSAHLKWPDVVFVLDFGHGLMQTSLRDYVQVCSPFLALNCQTNSNNHGFNIISRQYRRADAFTLDQQELMLSCGHRHIDFGIELARLREKFKSRYAWLTRGAVETIGQRDGQLECLCPPLEIDVVDTVGAGDAFFSVASLAAARQFDIRMATFLGQLAGAQAVRIVGNAHPISKAVLLKKGLELLKS